MTNQEIFDKVATHLLKQGKKSVSPGGECKYRGPDGTSCAVGCLITDESYSEGLENQRATSWDVQTALKASLRRELNSTDIGLLDYLQTVHDSYEPSDWRLRLGTLAENRNLSTKVLENL